MRPSGKVSTGRSRDYPVPFVVYHVNVTKQNPDSGVFPEVLPMGIALNAPEGWPKSESKPIQPNPLTNPK